jgi:hypothetical protein
VLEELTLEGLKAQLVPGVAFRGYDSDRRAWLIGTSLDVWQAIEAYKDFDEDFDRVVGETDLTERKLRVALDYYERFSQEIDELIARDRRPLAEICADYPHAAVSPVEID